MDISAQPPRRPQKRWGAVLERIARERILSRLDRRRLIMRWRPDAVAIGPSSIAPIAIGRIAAVPRSVMREADPAGMPRDWYAHFFEHGAILWTAIEDGSALGSLWVITAQRLGAWYLPIEPDAQVIYGVVTPERSRGRGIAAQLALAAARGAQGVPVYLDCMVWNRTAQRAFAKAGFVPVATVGSRWRERRAGPDA